MIFKKSPTINRVHLGLPFGLYQDFCLKVKVQRGGHRYGATIKKWRNILLGGALFGKDRCGYSLRLGEVKDFSAQSISSDTLQGKSSE